MSVVGALRHLWERDPSAGPAPAFTEIGRPRQRADGHAKVTGRATYTAEWPVEGMVHGAVVDSAIAAGRVVAIDARRALTAAGVIAVISHENAPRLAAYPKLGAGFPLTGEGGLGEVRQPLQDATIHYGAQSIAVVVAETAEQARHAATLVDVTYDEDAPELHMDTAPWTTRPKEFSGGEKLQSGGDEVLAAIHSSSRVVVREYQNPVYHHNPIEILASIAHWHERGGEERLLLYDTTRSVDMLRDVVAHSFDIPVERIRIVSKFIGGAFGSKAWTFHNPLLVALAAKVVGRPLRLEWRRQQVWSIGGHRPAQRHRLSIGAEPDGRIRGLHHWTRQHGSMVSGYTEYGSRMTKMMYDVGALGYVNELAHLHLPSPSVMRGPGFMTGGWALESALDELACELDLDPIALRIGNHADVDPDSGLPFSNKHLRECYARGSTLFGWAERKSQPRSTRVGRELIGVGMSSCMHPAAQQPASAEVRIDADGHVRARSATHELGNGSYTVFRQIAADAVGVPLDRVTFDLGDTAFPAAPPTHGSLTTVSVGAAVLEAGAAVLDRLREMASEDQDSPLHGVPPASITANDGRLTRADDPSVGDDYGAVLRRAGRTYLLASANAEPGDERKKHAFYSFGAVFAEVRVDEETGVTRLTRLCGVYDCGRLVNPTTARSQLMGGMLFALGQTMCEETVFDPHNGLPVIRNLADYHVASCADTPQITIEVLGIPDPHIGPLGAHGVGELGTNGVPSAVGNAIYNATGRRLRSLPYTPDKLLEASR